MRRMMIVAVVAVFLLLALGLWYVFSQQRPCSFTAPELRTMFPLVKNLLDHIAKHEGGKGSNAYKAVNRGKAGDSSYLWPKKNLGKHITQMTLRELRGHQGGQTDSCWFEGKQGEANLFAVGRYQLIPCTLQGALNTISGFTLTDTYDKETQDMLGVYLVMMKRPKVGDYLLGYHEDVVEAGQELAKEFASIPIQYSTDRCKRGASYYCGDSAGNMSHSKPEESIRELQKSREKLMKDQNVEKMKAEKCWF